MAEKFQNRYRISSARAQWHDYNEGFYFITICTAHHNHFFGEVRDGDMHLNQLGMKAHENLQHLTDHYPYANIDVFQVMPNHVHLIVCIDIEQNVVQCDDCRDVARRVSTRATYATYATYETRETGNTPKSDKMRDIANKRGLLSVAMGGFKSAITRYANDHNIPFGWQTRFHDHIIRDADEYERIALYIENNPKSWKQDKFNR